MKEQMKNRPKRGEDYEYNGERHTLYEWAKIKGMSFAALKGRIKQGWSIERTLTTPIREKICKNPIYCGKNT
jgi:hypothetical protein